MDTNDERPYWFPRPTDAAWIARIRSDYSATKDMSDDEVLSEYANSSQWQAAIAAGNGEGV